MEANPGRSFQNRRGAACVNSTGIGLPRSVADLLRARARTTPDAIALKELKPGYGWIVWTWEAYWSAVCATAQRMQSLGIKPGSRVALLGSNCAQWDICQFASFLAGGMVVGLDTLETPERLAAVCTQLEITHLVSDHREQAVTLEGMLGAERLLHLGFAATVVETRDDDQALQLPTGPTRHEDWDLIGPTLPNPTDAAIVIFTSGSSGAPRPIAYTHEQVLSAVEAILLTFDDLCEESRLACWLPLSGLFQRVLNFSAIGAGAMTHYVADPRKVIDYLPDIQPTIFVAVPRFLEKLMQGIEDQLNTRPQWAQLLFHIAIAKGDVVTRAARSGQPAPIVTRLAHSILDRLVLARARKVLGQRLHYVVSGSAPMPEWLLERFHAMGILILEAYGLSENIIPVCTNVKQRFRFGTVGQPLRQSQFKVAADGEILVNGPGVFHGYWKAREKATAQLDDQGFLHTGDICELDADGFVKIIGRKNDVFKTSTGRRVAPALVENALKQVPGVEHAVLFGAGQPELTALLVMEAGASDGQTATIPWRTWSTSGWLPNDAAESLQKALSRVLAPLPAHLRPAFVVVTERPFSVQTGELTTNLKMRRTAVHALYGETMTALRREYRHDRIGGNASAPTAYRLCEPTS